MRLISCVSSGYLCAHLIKKRHPLFVSTFHKLSDNMNQMNSDTKSHKRGLSLDADKYQSKVTKKDRLHSVSLSQLHKVVTSSLENNGLKKNIAQSIATVVCDAERDGCPSHGLFRVPGYVYALKHGGVDGTVDPIVTDSAPGMVTVDACDGFAVAAFDAGVSMLISKAKSQGVATLAIHRARHFNAVWREVEYLANQGLVALAFVNSAAFVAHAPGGSDKIYGTNPMAFGCPRAADKPPLVFDQASAAMARGEIQLLQRNGQSLPQGVALDPDGSPTLDPALGLAGAQLPMAGHKGSNLAMMIELLAAGVTASPFAPEAGAAMAALKEPLPLGGSPTINGELVIVLDPSKFGLSSPAVSSSSSSIQENEVGGGFGNYVESFLNIVMASQGEGGRLPGDRRHNARLKTRERGDVVEVNAELFSNVEAMSK